MSPVRGARSKRFTSPLHSHEDVTWAKRGTDLLVCSRGHLAPVRFVIPGKRDEAFSQLRALRSAAKKSVAKLTQREKAALDVEI